jgi:tRNA(fMet)-specific endonuclease VapC
VGVTLDTSVLIDLLAGERGALSCVRRLEGEGLSPVLSTVALYEVLSGIEYTRSRAERTRLEGILRRVPIEDFGTESARCSAELRAELLRAGRSPGAPDVMIAGHALSAGHTLVTRDRGLTEAARSLGLQVESY